MMTVGELIELLQGVPEYRPVVVRVQMFHTDDCPDVDEKHPALGILDNRDELVVEIDGR